MDPRALTLLNSRNNDRGWRATKTEGQGLGLWWLGEEPAWYRLLSRLQDIVLKFSWLMNLRVQSLCQL